MKNYIINSEKRQHSLLLTCTEVENDVQNLRSNSSSSCPLTMYFFFKFSLQPLRVNFCNAAFPTFGLILERKFVFVGFELRMHMHSFGSVFRIWSTFIVQICGTKVYVHPWELRKQKLWLIFFWSISSWLCTYVFTYSRRILNTNSSKYDTYSNATLLWSNIS